MKRILAVLAAAVVALSAFSAVYAAGSSVSYDGDSRQFVFEPGSKGSPTDLFTDFKGVMPGDSITQKITVKNDAKKNVKVKIYLRSLGAREGSAELLSQCGLRVKKSDGNEMAYMFDAPADETAGLTDWVCLGTLYSGGKVDLDVILTVPTELPNSYQGDAEYFIDWEFMVEEFPVEEGDPQAPQTGDNSHVVLWFVVALCSLILLVILLVLRKRDGEKDEKNINGGNSGNGGNRPEKTEKSGEDENF